jgi:hypothetical protein
VVLSAEKITEEAPRLTPRQSEHAEPEVDNVYWSTVI